MNQCQDRDLLRIEPVVFLGSGLPAQQLAAGTGGALSGTTFTAAGCDFKAAGVAPGMVLCTYTAAASEGSALEILDVPSPTTLTVSLLRPGTDDPPAAPPPASGLSFHVRTYRPQIQAVADTLAEKLRQISEAAGISVAEFVDSSQLRATVACGALAAIFVARADNATASDANWIKAEYHRSQFRQLQLQLRLAVDIDGDGLAESTRTLGNVVLRRS